MKPYIPILIVILLATPLLAEEPIIEGTELVAEEIAMEEITTETIEPTKKEIPETLLIIMDISWRALFIIFLTSRIANQKLAYYRAVRYVKRGKQEETPEERKLCQYCLNELFLSLWISAILAGTLVYRMNSQAWTIIPVQLYLLALTYNILATQINVRHFGEKGPYHEITANVWKKIKTALANI